MDKNVIDRQTEYAKKIMLLARDTVTVQFRFFDSALSKYKLEAVPLLNGYVANGEILKYDPLRLLKDYIDEPNIAVRLYLHVLFHAILMHAYRYDKANEDYWNIASDIAVEYIILSMDIPGASLMKDDEARTIISRLKKWVPEITAEKLYREFAANGISNDAYKDYVRLFRMDTHPARVTYKDEPETILTEEDWKKIAERVKAELKSFSKENGGDESIFENLNEATKRRYDYGAILRRFAVEGEEILVNPDEFDYIYYTYGLNTYGNLPLIEPLEYAENKKVKEFVIVIDTSASCRGEHVKRFLEETFDILSSTDAFFKDVNIHIIQCDSKVQEDKIVTNREDLNAFLLGSTFKGFGATDFRPAFKYVDELIENKHFENLRGLVYLTDGYGVYPAKKPEYDVIFAFLKDDPNRIPVPAWAIQVILEEEL